MEAIARLPSASSLLTLLRPTLSDDEEDASFGEGGFWYHPQESSSALMSKDYQQIPNGISIHCSDSDSEDDRDEECFFEDAYVGMDIDEAAADFMSKPSTFQALVPPNCMVDVTDSSRNESDKRQLQTIPRNGSALLDNVSDEVLSHMLSYLPSRDIRAFGATCQHGKAIVYDYDGHNGTPTTQLWHNLALRQWPVLRNNKGHRVLFKNDLDTTKQATEVQSAKLSILTALTAKTHPLGLQSSTFATSDSHENLVNTNRLPAEEVDATANTEENDAQTAARVQQERNRALLRRLLQQQPPSNLDFRRFRHPKESGSSSSFCDHHNTCKSKQEEVAVLQFVGSVGTGDRCIRSVEPFPRPVQKTVQNSSKRHKRSGSNGLTVLQSNEGPMLRGRNEGHFSIFLGEEIHRVSSNQSLSRRPASPPLVRNNGLLSRAVNRLLRRVGRRPPPSSSSSQLKTVIRPFVSPYIFKTLEAIPFEAIPSTIQVDVTPRMVAYYEIDIFHPVQDQQTRPRTAFAGPTLPQQPPQVPPPRPPAPQNPNANIHAPDDDEDRAPARECIAVGVSKNDFPLWGRMPGWDRESYGFHGDDGGIFHGRGDMVKRFGPSFGAGDTVGCGIDYVEKGIFFTHNGKFLGYAWTGLDSIGPVVNSDADEPTLTTDWYPTVGVDSNCPISFNFGDRPFAFDLGVFSSRHHKASRDALRKSTTCMD